jgi:histidyl-tRNA synthetase
MAKSAPPPGTSDIFPEEIASWHRLEDAARKIFPLYGFGELRTPVFEYTEVFQRGLGDDTEVVQKEMYTFEDRGGRSLTLRPEGTAGVMRALLGTDVMNGNERRVYYIGPMFRGERPAAGRRRQFHQIGVENVGRMAPELDAECIAMMMHYLEDIGISGSKLLLNTRGAHSDRKPAENALKSHFAPTIDKMCDDCKARFEKNIWRILDCKVPECQEFIEKTPDVVEFFSQESKDYFKKVCSILSSMGIEYEIDSRLVRGLDYYVHTVFELTHPGLGAQNAIAGGGRYELFLPDSKKPVIGVGYAAGMERLMMVREALKASDTADTTPVFFLAGLGEKAIEANMTLASKLRKAGLKVISEVENKSMKAQMRSANRIEAAAVIIRGENELENNIVVVKDMRDGSQQELNPDFLAEFLHEQYG